MPPPYTALVNESPGVVGDIVDADLVNEVYDDLTALFANALTKSDPLDHNGSTYGLCGATVGSPPTVTGSRGGNAALASLLTGLASRGVIIDGTTA